MHDRGIDQDRDGFFEWLVLEGEIKGLLANRTYTMYPYITLPESGLVDDSGPAGHSMPELRERMNGRAFEDPNDWDVTTDRLGTARFAFAFDGDELCDVRTEGRWTLKAGIFDSDGAELMARTRAWSWRRFGRRSIYGDSVHWSIGADSATVELTVGIFCHRADTLRLRAIGQYDPDFAADTSVVRRMMPGHSLVAITLPLRAADGRSPARMYISRLKIRVLGPGFGLEGAPQAPTRCADIEGTGWETGPWEHFRFRN